MRKRSGLRRATSSAWVPIDPVDPRSTMFRGPLTSPVSQEIANPRCDDSVRKLSCRVRREEVQDDLVRVDCGRRDTEAGCGRWSDRTGPGVTTAGDADEVHRTAGRALQLQLLHTFSESLRVPVPATGQM